MKDNLQKQKEKWLSFAESDLGMAEYTVLHTDQFLRQVCFLSQQAVEKLLKALYIHTKNEIPPKTHDIGELISQIPQIQEPLEKFKLKLAQLTDFYFFSRYPDAIDDENFDESIKKQDALDAVDLTKSIKSIIKKELASPSGV